jgi:hypothetical protein
MTTRFRDPILCLLAAAALAACSSTVEPSACRSDDACPAASRCEGGVCVAGGPPVATIQPLGPVEAFALVHLDGSPSHDPDGDEIVEHLWTVQPVTARCAPPEILSRTPVARVRFGCQGRYEVSLTVRDRLGVESEPRVADVDVGPSTFAPVVSTGPDLSSEHRCAGAPLVCRTTDEITLSAATSAGVPLRWTVEPPLDRPLAEGTRVRIAGTPAAASVVIETDGGAISGDWIFRAEAYDEYGVTGTAYTRVSVENRPPVLIADPPGSFPHSFDAVRSVFTSSGEIPWAAYDPDGDPFELSAVWRHVGDGGAPFVGSVVAGLTGGNVSFAVEVPFAVPEDALFLRGAPDLLRTIELFARDSNRAESRTSVPIDIGNRPPQPAGGPSDVQVPHRFDPLRSRYFASARVGDWFDPDGDPLFVATGAAPCDAFSVENGTLSVECTVPYEGIPAVEKIAGAHRVPVHVRDPWTDASAVVVHEFEVLNSPPALSRTVDIATVCLQTIVGWDTACIWQFLASPAQFTAHPTALDPDGDPLLVTALVPAGGSASPAQAICTTPECTAFRFVQPPIPFPCRTVYSAPSQLRATDGAASVTIDATPPATKC